MKWPWTKEQEGEEQVPIKDPELDEARRKKEDLMVRVVALGIEADTITRR